MLNSLKKLVEMARPVLSIYMRFPVAGEVTAVDAAHYTCDVQPLDARMSLLPKCRILTIWATKTTRIVALPAVGAGYALESGAGGEIYPDCARR